MANRLLTRNYPIYAYQIVQAFILLAFWVFGIAKYINTEPQRTLAIVALGFVASFIYTVVCISISPDNKLLGWMLKEW